MVDMIKRWRFLFGTGLSVSFVMIPHDAGLRYDGVNISLPERRRAVQAGLPIGYVFNEPIVQQRSALLYTSVRLIGPKIP